MKRDELLLRLQAIKGRGNLALQILEVMPQTATTETEARSDVAWLKQQLEEEFLRTPPERAQKAMTIFELSVYAPTIEEAWKKSGISRLKLNGAPTSKWIDVLEAAVYTPWKYAP